MKFVYGVVVGLSLTAVASFASVMTSLPPKVEKEFPVESQSYTGAFSSVLTNELVREETSNENLVEAKNLSDDTRAEGQNSGASSSLLNL